MKVVTLIQARMGSSRLPGKVLLPLIGQPLLLRMVQRVMLAQHRGRVVVISSILPEDDEIEKLCLTNNIICFRGHPTDLLDRHYQAALAFKADAVVKIPSDCPLIDPLAIDAVITRFLDSDGNYDYVSNLHPASWPDGNDVEIFSFKTLEDAWKEASQPFEREHTTPFIWERPDRFKLSNILWETGLDYSDKVRLTIDFKEDYELIKSIFDRLYPVNPAFGLQEIMALLQKNPHMNYINSKYHGKYWYDNHIDELTHIDEFKIKLKRDVK